MRNTCKMKKITGSLLALMMTAYTVTPGLSIPVRADELQKGDKVFDLVGITDFHGQLKKGTGDKTTYTSAVLAKAVKDVNASNPNRTLVIGGGDLYQGSPESNILHGVPVQKIMSNLGMEVTALGNHEFDWGLETINNETMKGAKYEILCANMFKKGTAERPYKPYKVITKDGVKIAVIGAISTDTPTIVLKSRVENYEFKDEAEEINKTAKQIKDNKEADVVLVSIHEGERDEANKTPLTNIAKKLKGVDAVFGGHSHWRKDMAVVDAEGKTRPVVIANCNGYGYVDMKMTVKADKTVEFSKPGTNYRDLKDLTAVDSEAKAVVDDAIKQVGPVFAEKIGSLDKPLNREYKGTFGDSLLGNWTSEAIRKAGNADVGVQNNGGIRCDIPAGDITVGTIFNLMPFDNELLTLELTGAQLKTLLNQAIVDGGKGIQIAGVRFEYDLSKPSMERVVKVTRENGKEIKADEKLVVATSDFLSTGTVEGFKVFGEKNAQASIKTDHKLLRDVFMEEVRATKTMKVEVDGRIKEGKASQSADKKIQILSTSDMHNRMLAWDYATDSANTKGSMAKVATKVKELKATNPNTILVDAGDVVQDNSADLFLDKTKYPVHPMIQGMNKLGYDVWTLGNHEFNYGIPKLKDFISTSKATVLCANLYDTDGKTRIAAPYKIIEKDGVKIGMIGITTPNITKWDSVNLKDYKVTGAVEETNAAIKELTGKVDMIMGVFHMGEQNEYNVPETGVIDVVSKCPGLSLVVAAHMHITIENHYVYNGKAYVKDAKGNYSTLDTDINAGKATEAEFNEAKEKGVMIVENGKFTENLGKLDLSFTNKNGKYELTDKKFELQNLSKVEEDKEFVELFKPYDEIAKKDAKVVIGQLKGGDLVPQDVVKGIPESQVGPTAMIDLINKVQMYYGEKISGKKIDVAAAAAFRGDANIKEGPITKSGTSLIYKYDNTLYVLEITGKQLKDYMEWSAEYYNQFKDGDLTVSFNPKVPGYNYDMFTGVKYNVDISKEAGKRIVNLTKMDGTKITDDMKLTIAVNDYRGKSQLMGNKSIFGSGDTAKLLVKSEDVMGDAGRIRDLLRSYIVDVKKGIITPECDNNWSIIGNNWDKTQRAAVIAAVNDGKLAPKTSEDGKTANGVALTWADVQALNVKLESVKLNNIETTVGETTDLMAILTPAYASVKDMTWSVSDPSVATIKGSKLTALKAGKATITVNVDGKIATTEVVIKEKSGVKPVDPSKPGTNNNNNTNSSNANNSNTNNKANTGKLVKTGSPVGATSVVIGGAVLIGIGAFMTRRKKNVA